MQLPILFLLMASLIWLVPVSMVNLSLFSSYIPHPYMDEFFHIPQIQEYCKGHWEHWDNKITTPPGSYLPPVLLANSMSYIYNLVVDFVLPTEHNETFKTLFGEGGVTPENLCTVGFIRGVNTSLSFLLYIIISLLVRDLTYNPLYPTLNSAQYIRNILNNSTSYVFCEALIMLQSLILWFLPFSSFFYSMAYTDTSSTLSLVIIMLLSRRLVPFYSCEKHTMTRGFDPLRHFVVLFFCLWSVCIRQTNIIWIGFIATITILQSVHHEFYYLATKATIYTGQQGKLIQEKRNKGGDKGVAKKSSSTTTTTTTPTGTTLQPPYAGTVHPELHLPSLHKARILSFGQSIKGFFGALFNYKIFFSLSPHLITLGCFIAFLRWNGGIVLGDKSNHQVVLHWAQIPIFLSVTAFFFPFFAKLPLISPTHPMSSGERNDPKKQMSTVRGYLRLFMMIVGHLIGIGALCLFFWKALGQIYPHPFILADQRHYTYTAYRILTGTPYNLYTKAFPRIVSFLNSNSIQGLKSLVVDFITTGPCTIILQYFTLITTALMEFWNITVIPTIHNLITPQTTQSLSQIITSSLSLLSHIIITFLHSHYSSSHIAQIILTPIALHMFYIITTTNPLPALFWFLFSSITVVPTGLIEPRYYIPILLFAFFTVQHREGNLIIRIVQNDAISIRLFGWLAWFGMFLIINIIASKVFFFDQWVMNGGSAIGRLMW